VQNSSDDVKEEINIRITPKACSVSLCAGRPFVLVFQQSLREMTRRVVDENLDISPAM
jgi:hypothetical protein